MDLYQENHKDVCGELYHCEVHDTPILESLVDEGSPVQNRAEVARI